MIDAEAIERAERTLRIIYGGTPESLPRQLASLEISEEAFANFQTGMFEVLKKRYRRAWYAMDPRIEPAMGSLTYHFFLVGVIAGRQSAQEGA